MNIHMRSSLLIILLMSPLIVCARSIRVVVCSTNDQKISAVYEAFSEVYPDDAVECIACATSSLIPEQPIGKETAICGARNRLSGVQQETIQSADYVVSIENYIEQAPSGSWCDRGLLLFKDVHKGAERIVTTEPTFIPGHFVDLAREMSAALDVSASGYSMTIGQAIQKVYEDRPIDPHDWHREAEFGGVSRKKLLKDALFKVLHADVLDFLKSKLESHQDFPKPGILFVDFLPILQDAKAFGICIDLLCERYKSQDIEVVVGLESRGFLLGAALACKLGIGFVPVRKPGKLPGAIHAVSYEKEYGFDTLTIAQNALTSGSRVLIIDDLIATGGSARSAIELVIKAGGIPVEFVSLLKIPELAEMAKLNVPSFNLID